MQQAVSAGMSHTLVCTGTGRVYAFGASRHGQVGNGREANTSLPVELGHGHPNGDPHIANERIISVDCGYEHSAAVSSRGVLYTWGKNVNGCLGHGSEVLGEGTWEPNVRSRCMPAAVKAFLHNEQDIASQDNSAASSSQSRHRAGSKSMNVSTLTSLNIVRIQVQQVSCGSEHTLCVDKAGSMWSWGCGAYGALGHGDTVTLHAPKKLNRIKSSIKIYDAMVTNNKWEEAVACAKDPSSDLEYEPFEINTPSLDSKSQTQHKKTAGKRHLYCRYLDLAGKQDEIDILRPQSILVNSLQMGSTDHLKRLLRLSTSLFAQMDDPTTQTRYLMLMNAAIRRDIILSRRLNGLNLAAYKVDERGLFKGLLNHLIGTEIIRTCVINSFREVMGHIMKQSISFIDAQAVEVELNPQAQKLRQVDLQSKHEGHSSHDARSLLSGYCLSMIEVPNRARPLELDPEPCVVASMLAGKVGNTSDDISTLTSHRRLKNRNLYAHSKAGDRELFNRVNERATNLMNVSSQWFRALLRFFQVLPASVRWFCHQYQVHLNTIYSENQGNLPQENGSMRSRSMNSKNVSLSDLRSRTCLIVLSFVLEEFILPTIFDENIWIRISVEEKWGASIEAKEDEYFWTFQRLEGLRSMWSGNLQPEIRDRVQRNLYSSINMLRRIVTCRPFDTTSPWLVGVNKVIFNSAERGVSRVRKFLTAASELDMQNLMISQMYSEHIRRTTRMVQMPLDVMEYLRFVLMLMGPKIWPKRNHFGNLIWAESGILGDESARNDTRLYDPKDRRYSSYPVSINYKLDIKMPVDMSGIRSAKLYTKGMGAGTLQPHGSMTVVSLSTGCVMPASLAIGRPVKLFVFGAGGGNMDGITLGGSMPNKNLAMGYSDTDDEEDSDEGDSSGAHFESHSSKAAKQDERSRNKEKANRILEARRAAHLKARDALQEFLRDPHTPLSQLLASDENPIHLMMRLVQNRQSKFERLDQYDKAAKCRAVRTSLEQLVMQAKPLSAVLLEILEALRQRKDQANSLSLSFRQLERLRIEFNDYDAWLHEKLTCYTECIDLVRYGISATQNRTTVIPLALRKGINLTKPNLVQSRHPRVSSIKATFNQYGQVHGIHCKYSYKVLKKKGVVREVRLVSEAGSNFGQDKDEQNASEGRALNSRSKGIANENVLHSNEKEGFSSDPHAHNEADGNATDVGAATTERKGLGMIDHRVMKRILNRIIYEFTARAGEIEVITVYSKSFIVNRTKFKTLDLQQIARIGEAAFEPQNTCTSFGTVALLKLVEEMTMQALLL